MYIYYYVTYIKIVIINIINNSNLKIIKNK